MNNELDDLVEVFEKDLKDKLMDQTDIRNYSYIGGGYYRLKGIKKGEVAPTIHGPEFQRLAIEQIERQLCQE